jgi:hypothetical protein
LLTGEAAQAEAQATVGQVVAQAQSLEHVARVYSEAEVQAEPR